MTKPISKLRQRMIEDMAFRNMSPATQKCYTYAVASFARHHHASPDQLGVEHVRAYRLHLLKRGLKARSINPIVGALRFFFATKDRLRFGGRKHVAPSCSAICVWGGSRADLAALSKVLPSHHRVIAATG